jgi:Protein of unknown function (DUF3294)
LFVGINNLTFIVNNMNNTVTNMNNEVDNLTGFVNSMNNTLDNVEARSINAVSTDQDDPLTSLSNADGDIAGNFPPTLGALHAMTWPTVTALLDYYGLPHGGPVESRLQRFKKFIGIRP